MFITKKHIPRRAFLRGAGVTLALPLLDSMVPAQTPLAKTGGDSRRPASRASSFRMAWRRDTGFRKSRCCEAGKLPFIMKPLDPFIDQTVIMSGMWSKSAEPPPGETGADHWVAAAYLCADKPKKTTGADIYDGTTIDQMIAQKIGQETLLPSLQLALEDPGANSSNCGEGYSCAYTNSISWSSPDPAAADGTQSAGRLRAPVRRRRHRRRSAPRAASRIAAFSIPSRRSMAASRRIWARATALAWTNTKPTFAKSSAGWKSPRNPQARRTPTGSSLPPAFRNRSTST